MGGTTRQPGEPQIARSLLLVGPGDVRWTERALPPLGPRDLLVETRAGAISLGTEVPHYRGTSRNVDPPTYPAMTGYEDVGVVRARGAAVEGLAVGARVVATYGHRTRAVLPEARAIAIPPDIGDELALLTILSGDVATGVGKLGDAARGPTLVTGAGAIGLLAVFVLAARGAAAIDVVEPLAARRALALALGARRAVPPEEAATLADGYAAGVECSSRDAAFALLQRRVRPHGRICVVADGNLEPLRLDPAFHARQLVVVGTSDCPDYHAHARWYFPAARRAADHLPRLFDRRIAAADLPATFAALAGGALVATKIFVRYDDAR